MAIEEKVKQIVAEQLGVDESQVTENASFMDDLGADSLDTVELVMELEDHFDVSIPDEAISDVTGDDDWQTGTDRLTMTKLAEIVDQQKR